jgi:hypothetical protein
MKVFSALQFDEAADTSRCVRMALAGNLMKTECLTLVPLKETMTVKYNYHALKLYIYHTTLDFKNLSLHTY